MQAQKRNARYVEYINKYSDLAVEQMKLHKIPASITLAQGLLESGAGYSQLARKSNNHFGIKCGGSWRGRTVRHDDDARNECFRAYKHPRDSYEDHSDFLRRGARYAFLFKLDITDYKGWARGLKKQAMLPILLMLIVWLQLSKIMTCINTTVRGIFGTETEKESLVDEPASGVYR